MWEDEIRVVDDQKVRQCLLGASCYFAEWQGVPYQTLETESKKCV